MAIVQSGNTSDCLTVDATSKAMRITPYKSSIPVRSTYVGTYSIPIRIVTTATTGTWFYMKNTGQRYAFIRKMYLWWCFTGTSAVSSSQWQWRRGIHEVTVGLTPATGTLVEVVRLDPAFPTSTIGDVRSNAAVTVTGLMFEQPLHLSVITNQNTTDHWENITFSDSEDSKLVIQPGESLVLSSFNTGVTGSNVMGSIIYDERMVN